MATKLITPNPQGKGLTPLVDSLLDLQKQLIPAAKPISQIAAELFTSLFILESNIRFKPVLGKKYWLYHKNGNYHLSLINPNEWPASLSGTYIGKCQLLNDLTWSLALSDQVLANPPVMAELKQRQQQFEQQLKAARQLQEVLPVYVGSFSFHSRVMASALAYSLGSSMKLTGISDVSYAKAIAQQNLPELAYQQV